MKHLLNVNQPIKYSISSEKENNFYLGEEIIENQIEIFRTKELSFEEYCSMIADKLAAKLIDTLEAAKSKINQDDKSAFVIK